MKHFAVLMVAVWLLTLTLPVLAQQTLERSLASSASTTVKGRSRGRVANRIEAFVSRAWIDWR
jgi:hypothetical protein